MGIIVALIIGLFIGIIARFLMPGRAPGGFFITAMLGIAGSMVAHLLGGAMGMYAPNEPAGFIASVIGAMILLGLYRVMKKD